jgi:hypothetical protein
MLSGNSRHQALTMIIRQPKQTSKETREHTDAISLTRMDKKKENIGKSE